MGAGTDMNLVVGVSWTRSDQDWMNLMIFNYYQMVFALPVEPIQQMIERASIVPIQPANEYIEGMVNYQETLVPVISLCAYLSLPKGAIRQCSPIILIKIQNGLAGLLIDDVQEIISVPRSWVIASGEIFPKGAKVLAILRGLVKDQDKMAMLLDLDRLLLPF